MDTMNRRKIRIDRCCVYSPNNRRLVFPREGRHLCIGKFFGVDGSIGVNECDSP
jgi:hypothetical protein